MNLSLDARVATDRPLSVVCELRKWVDRDTAVAAIDNLPQLNGGIALCLTVYNEPAEALYASISGLSDSIRYLHRLCPDVVVSICVLVDGLSKCSSSVRAVLDRFAGPDFFLQSDSKDLACLYAAIDLSDLSVFDVPRGERTFNRTEHRRTVRTQELQRGGYKERESTSGVQLLIAVKRENRGKLDSHWWFYRIFCPHLEPAYCFQMDVGTVPTEQALHSLTRAFQLDSRVGAAASSIMPPQPSRIADLLQCWQYFSFANSMLLDWPAENVAGYLSVVPGQLSAVRWEAIDGHMRGGPHEDVRDPLRVYFKGLEALTPYESMLYAAEDRVLCREIVSNPEVSWTITHVDDALAITDLCDSWGELLRQRKRWCNGYIACRVNFIKNLPHFLAEPKVTARRKIRSATAGVYHSVMIVNDWLSVAVFVLLLYHLSNHAASLLSRFPWVASGLRQSFWVAVCTLIVQFLIFCRGSPQSPNLSFFRFSIALQSIALVTSLCVTILFGRATGVILELIFLLAALPFASLMGHRRHTCALFIRIPMIVINWVVSPLVWMYAVCNVHDSSWGTKGLLSDTRYLVEKDAGKKVRFIEFHRFRIAYLSLWILSNLCFSYFFERWFGSKHIPAVIALLSVNTVIMLSGLVCRLFTKLHIRLGAADHQIDRRVAVISSETARSMGDSRAQAS